MSRKEIFRIKKSLVRRAIQIKAEQCENEFASKVNGKSVLVHYKYFKLIITIIFFLTIPSYSRDSQNSILVFLSTALFRFHSMTLIFANFFFSLSRLNSIHTCAQTYQWPQKPHNQSSMTGSGSLKDPFLDKTGLSSQISS